MKKSGWVLYIFEDENKKDLFKIMEFKTIKEYTQWINKNLLRFNKEQLKSYGELYIANYLTLNGIKYKYEKQYNPYVKSKNNKIFKERYRPDFYLCDYDIYIDSMELKLTDNSRKFTDTSIELTQKITFKTSVLRYS